MIPVSRDPTEVESPRRRDESAPAAVLELAVTPRRASEVNPVGNPFFARLHRNKAIECAKRADLDGTSQIVKRRKQTRCRVCKACANTRGTAFAALEVVSASAAADEQAAAVVDHPRIRPAREERSSG